MRRYAVPFSFFYCFCIAGLPPTAAQSETGESEQTQLKLVEDEDVIVLLRGEAPVLTYNKRSPKVPQGISDVYRRSGFLHPIQTPQGRVVSATFPLDHPHQHGVFFAWVRTRYADRKVDFWNLAGGTGRVLHERVVSTTQEQSRVGFEVDLIHRATEEPAIDILRSRWQIELHPGDTEHFCFDLRLTQQALTDTPLEIQKYHYGGMAYRGPVRWLLAADRSQGDGPKQREPNGFRNDLGSDRLQGNHQHARWVTLYGEVEGKPVSVTVLSHPDNFRHPQAARLHPTKPYFCFAPCVDGGFQISKQSPYSAAYRYLVTDSKPDADWLEQQWRKFVAR